MKSYQSTRCQCLFSAQKGAEQLALPLRPEDAQSMSSSTISTRTNTCGPRKRLAPSRRGVKSTSQSASLPSDSLSDPYEGRAFKNLVVCTIELPPTPDIATWRQPDPKLGSESHSRRDDIWKAMRARVNEPFSPYGLIFQSRCSHGIPDVFDTLLPRGPDVPYDEDLPPETLYPPRSSRELQDAQEPEDLRVRHNRHNPYGARSDCGWSIAPSGWSVCSAPAFFLSTRSTWTRRAAGADAIRAADSVPLKIRRALDPAKGGCTCIFCLLARSIVSEGLLLLGETPLFFFSHLFRVRATC